MKVNKLTEGYNLRWESSRMMLPEHKEAILEHQKADQRKGHPGLDEQLQQLLEYTIRECMVQGTAVKVTVFGEYENVYYTGKITKIDAQLGRIKIEGEESCELIWLSLADILEVEAI